MQKIDNPNEIILNMSNNRVSRLGADCTPWISRMCKGDVLLYFETQEALGGYDHHFKEIDENAAFPEDQQTFRSVLSVEDMRDVAVRRSKQISDWMHKKCSVWAKYTFGANNLVKKKEDCEMAPMEETHHTPWCDDAIRHQCFKNAQLGPRADTNHARLKGAQISRADIVLVIAHFPQLISKCEEYCLRGDFAKRCVKKHDVLCTFTAMFAEYLMVCKASPYFIVEKKADRAKQQKDKEDKAKDDYSWFLKAINSMGAVSALSQILPNLAQNG